MLVTGRILQLPAQFLPSGLFAEQTAASQRLAETLAERHNFGKNPPIRHEKLAATGHLDPAKRGKDRPQVNLSTLKST